MRSVSKLIRSLQSMSSVQPKKGDSHPSGIINPFNLSVQRCSADKPGSSGLTFAFSALYFCHSSYSLFVICFMAVTSLGGNLLLQIYHILCERKSNVKMSRIMLRVFDLPLYCSVCPFRCIQ